GLFAALDQTLVHQQLIDSYFRWTFHCVLHYRRVALWGRIRNSRMMPARKPPMWANQAVPPASPPPHADELNVRIPLKNWITIQRPSTTSAGQRVTRAKKPNTTSI